MTDDMLIRKKTLKIQERLGMRIGVSGGIRKHPVVKTTFETLNVLRELYKIGVKAFVLPRELFSGISTTTDLYKTKYADLLKIREEAKKMNIELSIQHQALTDLPDETLKTFCNIYSIMDCRTFTIKPDFYRMMPQEQARKLVVHKINEIVSELRTNVKIGIETTGRVSELGSLEDVIDIVKRTSSTEPILNWGNIHGRGSGTLRDERDFSKIIEKVRNSIGNGSVWLKNAYFFFSGVSYGPSGVIKTIPLAESDLNLEMLIKTAMSFGISGTIIFEDPDKEKFILKMLDKMADMVR